jgi:hypothetical protein
MAPLPINHLAEPGFGAAGAALMAARMAHRGAQEHAANYQHPPSIPFAHAVGRPGEPTLAPPSRRKRRPPGPPPNPEINPLAGLY